MANRTLVVAPHPDDEMLGCGGLLLRRKREGSALGWLIVTAMREADGWPAERMRQREAEIREVTDRVGFDSVYNLGLPTTRLDTLPMGDVVAEFSRAFADFQPDEVLLPHPGDVHTDHRVVFDAGVACSKWFRYSSVRRVMTYETLSETDFGLTPGVAFSPNVFVDIANDLEEKIAVLSIYRSELAAFPFPRSAEAVRGLAATRGAACGATAAEAFMLLRERQ